MVWKTYFSRMALCVWILLEESRLYLIVINYYHWCVIVSFFPEIWLISPWPRRGTVITQISLFKLHHAIQALDFPEQPSEPSISWNVDWLWSHNNMQGNLTLTWCYQENRAHFKLYFCDSSLVLSFFTNVSEVYWFSAVQNFEYLDHSSCQAIEVEFVLFETDFESDWIRRKLIDNWRWDTLGTSPFIPWLHV